MVPVRQLHLDTKAWHQCHAESCQGSLDQQAVEIEPSINPEVGEHVDYRTNLTQYFISDGSASLREHVFDQQHHKCN